MNLVSGGNMEARITFKLFFLLLGLTLALLANQTSAKGQNIILCGGSPGGLWSLLGAGLNSAVQKIDSSSVVTYQTSSGGFANLSQTSSGKCDVSIAHIGEIVIAEKGSEPFSAPVTGTRAIALLYDWAPMQWLVDKKFAEKHRLKKISDLSKGNLKIDLVVNRKGILPSILAESSLQKSGMTFEEILNLGGSIQYQGSKAASQIMQDRKADIWVNATFIGSGKIKAIAKVRDLTMLSVDNSVVEKMSEEFGSKPFVIKSGSYIWLAEDVETFGAQAALVGSVRSDDAKIELIAKAISLYPEEIQKVHPAMRSFNLELAKSVTVVPYHQKAAAISKGN